MLEIKYRKPLYKLAKSQVVESGLNRSIIHSPDVLKDIASPLWSLVQEVDRVMLSDNEILPHLVGEEGAKLLAEKCLNTYWTWEALRLVALRKDSTPVVKSILEMRSEAKIQFRDELDLPLAEMEPIQIAKFVAYGLLLWNSRNGTIIPNPIFF